MKVWEGKTTHQTEMGVTDGKKVTKWRVKHESPEKRTPVPSFGAFVTVRVTYCATEKGSVVVAGDLIA